MHIKIGKTDIELIRKKIKHMHLYVMPPDGRVKVTAPKWVSITNIREFVDMHHEWIIKQQKKISLISYSPELRYETGETIDLWGEKYMLTVHDGGYYAMELSGNEAVMNVRNGSTIKNRRDYVNEWYRGLLKVRINESIGKWEDLTQLYCNSWQIKFMRTRWGTCNTNTRKIWINLQLAKKPYECLEYVILHEIIHLKYPKHDRNFYRMMDLYMPEWKKIKTELNENVSEYRRKPELK